ncbi:hypothetical protein BU16DRAFT_240180 [Lophium mytilinum]|uniref:F-box domain-containing protein n=1 Tax=Lophium mytilinum TaxID=390894 RepID=A0A6A6R6W6_9PEZI|nr:hypothetical protein BU16DRAFT_240180 [Lophium mytilinum]
MITTPPAKPWEPTGPFRFLDLPRELRDVVYGHIFNSLPGEVSESKSPTIVKPAKGEGPVYDRPDFRLQKSHVIIQSCKQVHEEVKDTIYGLHTFSITLDKQHPHFHCPLHATHRTDGSKIPLPSNAANADIEDAFMDEDLLVRPPVVQYNGPFRGWMTRRACYNRRPRTQHGWDLTAVRKLNLKLDLALGREHYVLFNNRVPDVYKHLSNFSFRGLYAMKELQDLCVSIAYGPDCPPALLAFFEGNGKALVKVRELIRTLMASIPKTVNNVRWNFTKSEYDVEWTVGNAFQVKGWTEVNGNFLEKLAKEFEACRGMDAEYFQEEAEAEVEAENE